MARVISTRHVTIVSAEGDRLKEPAWSKPRYWRKSKDVLTNLKQAITYARKVLDVKRIGTVVYVGDMPVFHCKWGGGSGYSGWKNNPVANYWRRKLS